MNELVSVIIPTYKRSEFLCRAIDSILSQTYKYVEIVVVDDNNPDSSYRELTEKKMSQYINNPMVHYIKNNRNLGGALARNEGIKKSNGKFITFLDDDDIYLKSKIENQIEFMINNSLDLSFTNVRIHSFENDKLIDYRSHNYVKSCDNKELLRQHLMHHLTPTSTYMFNKCKLIEIGMFDDVKVGQEFMLMLKAINNNLSIGYLTRDDIIQYIHDQERISVGNNKVTAEYELLNLKRKYYGILSINDRRYIKFRHHAVLLVVGLRKKDYLLFLKNLVLGLLIGFDFAVKELLVHIKKMIDGQNSLIEVQNAK